VIKEKKMKINGIRRLMAALFSAILTFTGGAALFAQFEPGLYEDKNRRPVPETGSLIDALIALDKAIVANGGNGYGDYVIRVLDGYEAPTITFLAGVSSYGPTTYNFAHLSRAALKGHTLRIEGISADGEPPSIYLKALGNMFNMEDNANVALSVENLTLHGLSTTWEQGWPNDSAEPLGSVQTSHNLVGDNIAPLVYVGTGCAFDMKKNATITGNSNIDAVCGGVYVNGGVLTMSGTNATIRDNRAIDNGGGVFMNGGTLTISGKNAAICGNYVDRTIEGSIDGVYPNMGALPRLRDTAIQGINLTVVPSIFGGGGVYMNGGVLTLSGANATIRENYVGGGYGGGVFLSGGEFKMYCGGILNNTASDSPVNTKNFCNDGGTATWPAGTTVYTGAIWSDRVGAEQFGTTGGSDAVPMMDATSWNIWAERP
jgi:hypothetical protein